MNSSARPFAVVTGASTGIGYELGRECIENGFDVLIAADEPQIQRAAETLRQDGARVEAVQANLVDRAGVDKLYSAVGGRSRCPTGERRAGPGRRISRPGT
jgi:NAD(P)-dependent dehydrogenase (short-subunit alcohol dehydrogenase family)